MHAGLACRARLYQVRFSIPTLYLHLWIAAGYAGQIEKAELEFGDREELESKLEELLAAAPEPTESDEEDSEESD
jgi:hypothetical protein